MISVVLILAAGGIIGLLSNSIHGLSARLRYRTFQSAFNECQLLLNTTSGPQSHLGRGIALAQETLDRQGMAFWGAPNGTSWDRWLTPREQIVVREQAAELILLEARAKTYLATRYGSEADQRKALEWAVARLDQAEQIDPKPTAALYGDRARYLAALGLADRAGRDRQRLAELRPRESRDFALLGTSLLANRDFEHAEPALVRAVTLDPQRFWAWFGLGHCHFEQGRYLEAAGDFNACTVLQPKFAWPYLNRGLALARAGLLVPAREAYDQALKTNPNFAEARVNRALTCLELNDLATAEDDLRRAVALGRTEAGVLAALAETLGRLGRRGEAEALFADRLSSDPENPAYRIARAILRLESDPAGARADLDRVLARDPRNARALYVMARLVRPTDPRAALHYAESAYAADPNLLDALQLRALLRAHLGDLAAIDDAERLALTPTPNRLYNAACTLAVLARTTNGRKLETRALAMLSRALEAGLSPNVTASDPDWDVLRERPEFRALIRSAIGAQPPAASAISGPTKKSTRH
jgi:tetratricopeptide (TPR) repeat protein